jgi:hypothetical protein
MCQGLEVEGLQCFRAHLVRHILHQCSSFDCAQVARSITFCAQSNVGVFRHMLHRCSSFDCAQVARSITFCAQSNVGVTGGQTFSASAATGSSWFCLIWSNISAVFFGLRIHIMRSEGKWRERSVSLDWMLPCAISELMLETG